jgi:hypothetical protein
LIDIGHRESYSLEMWQHRTDVRGGAQAVSLAAVFAHQARN